MSFRRRAGGGKRDSAEADIVESLRKLGVRVYHVGGQGNPDLLCYFGERFVPLEVKTGTGALTRNQGDIPWKVVRTFDEAWSAILKAR